MTTRRAGLAALAIVVAALGACGDAAEAPTHIAAARPMAMDMPPEREMTARDSALVRELVDKVAKYRSFARARQDGYDTAITPCMENRPIGGMGVHYARTSLIDGTVHPLNPEVLLYRPGKGGANTLVGVEFIVPFTAWTDPQPPELFGQVFAANQTFQVWALHVWTTLANPHGLFADWNPLVSC